MAIPRNLANIAPHVNASSTELVFNDGGANLDFRVEGDTNANLLFADAGAEKVGFGTNTFNTNGGVLQVSNGISFPATQSACADVNTLDDYEEGTWTPTVVGATVPGTPTYTIQSGSYTKVGNSVHIQGQIQISSLGGASGSLFLAGLPFSSQSGNSWSALNVGLALGMALPVAGYNLVGHIPATQTTVQLNLWNNTSGTNEITAAQFSASGRMAFAMDYTV